ncbi:lipopolysaccharide transport periplasmic protein LptA [Paracoccus sp. (in: a-proteobacteria)]|uniref:lipopolysaccharide transport periplasmic protein LptA n=1 Tax=Paracoccus sp. TaxID=267 RepID=UPI0026DF9E45|nr:lipopolysaccharide transport periplasmic protein LptA [Paracoccus sp. (in: a-proteobacteria)]MDO5370197.1 lipopolysaccharide transport periplasmic protein LptA [Paracoccus sp. (in: a-proteobacteria)]
MLRSLILSGLLALALPLAAAAQTVGFGAMRADADAPVEVTSDSLRVNQDTGEAVFTGNVLIGQGQMRLSAQSVTVVYAEGGQNRIRSLNATGGVTLVSGPDAAEAAEAVYDVETGTIVLTGDAIVTRGDSVLAGDRIEVSLDDGTASVSGRVRTVLQPGQN